VLAARRDVSGGYPGFDHDPAGSFTDVDGDALTYTATLSTGAVLPSW